MLSCCHSQWKPRFSSFPFPSSPHCIHPGLPRFSCWKWPRRSLFFSWPHPGSPCHLSQVWVGVQAQGREHLAVCSQHVESPPVAPSNSLPSSRRARASLWEMPKMLFHLPCPMMQDVLCISHHGAFSLGLSPRSAVLPASHVSPTFLVKKKKIPSLLLWSSSLLCAPVICISPWEFY